MMNILQIRFFSTVKQKIARYQLKHLPDPLAKVPPMPSAYGLFVKQNYEQYKQDKATETIKNLSKQWKLADQAKYNAERNKLLEERNETIKSIQKSLNAFDYYIIKARRRLSAVAGKRSLMLRDPQDIRSGYALFAKDLYSRGNVAAAIGNFRVILGVDEVEFKTMTPGTVLSRAWAALPEQEKKVHFVNVEIQ
jgi:hypothetical protein